MAEVQQTATTAKNPYAPNPYRSKFKSIISEMRRKNEDPEFIRYVMDQEGYDMKMVNEELANLDNYGTGQPMQQKAVDPNAVPGADLDQNQLAEGQRSALLYGQRMYVSGKILDSLDEGVADKGFFGAVGQKIDEMQVGGTITGQFVGEEFKKFDQAKRDFINASLRRESGAVISPQEFDNADKQYFPVPGDSADVLAQKKANRELQAKGFLKSAGVDDAEINFDAKEEKKDGSMTANEPKPRVSDPAAVQAWLDANPNDPRAEQVRKLLEEQNRPLGDSAAQESSATVQPTEDASGFSLGKAAGKVGDFLGIKKFGEGIGVTIFLKTTEGKDLQKKAAEGDKVALETLQAILDEAPSAKEVIGSAALTALNVASFGTAKGVAGASTVAGKVAAGTATGAAYGVAGGAEQNKDSSGILKSGLVGAVTGGVVSGIASGAQKLSALRKAKLPKQAEEAVGQIIQGKTKDVAPALKTLSQVDTKGVSTYTGLKEAIKTNTKALGLAMDEVLSRDGTTRTLDQLTTATNVGGKEVKVNYIKQALENLDELYTKTNDPVDAQKIKNLLEKAATQGLTLKEMNDIAKRYGTEFGKKAFSKTGDALTSVNSVAYENVRSGVKGVVRELLPDDTAKAIDKTLSEHLNTSALVDKMVEKVNALNQKIGERGFIEKGAIKVAKVADLLTGHGLRGLASGVLPSNVGLKTMNAVDLERLLQKNLSVLEKLNRNPSLLQKAVEKAGKSGAKVTLPLILNAVREITD